MTDDAAKKEKPSKVLASRITARLVNKRLVSADRQTKIEDALATGNMSQQDWRLEIERAIDRGKGPANAPQN